MKTILCFGDSITFGVGNILGRGWYGNLKKHYKIKGEKIKLHNLGVSGHTSVDLLKRFHKECTKHASKEGPNLIIIAIGENDTKWIGHPDLKKVKVEKKVFEKNIVKLIKEAKKYAENVLILGFLPVDETKTVPFSKSSFTNKRIIEFDKSLERICKSSKTHYLHFFTPMNAKKHQDHFGDGLHPNKKGYLWMFMKLRAYINKHHLI